MDEPENQKLEGKCDSLLSSSSSPSSSSNFSKSTTELSDYNLKDINSNPLSKNLKIEEEDDLPIESDSIGILTRKNKNLAEQITKRSLSVNKEQRPWHIKLQITTPCSGPIQMNSLNDESKSSQNGTIASFHNNYQYSSKDHAHVSFSVFNELWESKQVCDVILKIDGHEFPAHRSVLCATIPYFYAMFTNDLAERNLTEIELKSPNVDDVETPSLSVEAFESILRFAYTGSITINALNVQSILIAASFFGLTNVQQACTNYLISHINIKNVLIIKSFAVTLGCHDMIQASQRFIHFNFEEISKNCDFLNLHFDELKDILKSDELNVSNEKTVYEALMRWIKYDEEIRKQYLPQLLKEVRLPLLCPEYLTDTILADELIRNSVECRDLIDEAKDYHLLPLRRSLIPYSRTRPRSGHHVQGFIYAIGGVTKTGDSMSTVEVYDPHTKRWRIAEAMTMMRSHVGVAVMDGKLYAIGGYNGFDRLNSVEVYDSKLEQWKGVRQMRFRRSAVGAASSNGFLYACGGYDGSVSLNVVERYLASTNEWTDVKPMMTKRSAVGVVALDGYIYALGGHDGLIIFNTVERYDPKTDQWEFVEPMLNRRCRLGVTTYGGKIYVCGGYDGCTFLQTAEVYDPQKGKWSYIAKMQMVRSRVALVANCAKLFAIGGYDGSNNLSSVETYDIESDRWEFIPSMVAHEGGVGVGVVPNN